MTTIINKKTEAENVLGLVKKLYKAEVVYIPELKVISYDNKEKGPIEKMLNYLRNVGTKTNKDYHELIDKITPINNNFPRITGFFIELFGGYTKL